MAPVTIAFGAILIVLGGGFYMATHRSSVTALIPAFLGCILVVLGLLAFKEKFRKHAMHLAALFGLIGLLGGAVMGFPRLIRMLAGVDVDRPAAIIEQSVMAGVCLVFVGLCVNSFIQARRRRSQEQVDKL